MGRKHENDKKRLQKEPCFTPIQITCLPYSAARVELSQSVGGKKGKAKALYDFHGENEDELSFKVSTSQPNFPKGVILLQNAKKIGFIYCENRLGTRKNKAHRAGTAINTFDKGLSQKIFALTTCFTLAKSSLKILKRGQELQNSLAFSDPVNTRQTNFVLQYI